MITSTDFLRELSFGEWVGHDEPVRRWMSSPGRSVESETPLGQVAEITEQFNQEFAVVVRRYRPMGILSRTALRMCLYGGGDANEISEMRAAPVRMLVSSLPELTAEMSLSQAATLMLEHRAQALAVVERTRMLLGLLQEDDILRAMLQRLTA
jgi:CBS domain-containing protein